MTKEELEKLARGERIDGEAYSRQALAQLCLKYQRWAEKAEKRADDAVKREEEARAFERDVCEKMIESWLGQRPILTGVPKDNLERILGPLPLKLEPISDGDVSTLDGSTFDAFLDDEPQERSTFVSFKPKDITLSTPLPLANSDMRKVEREFAAALIVRALQKADNEWKPIALKLIQDSYNEDVRAKLEPWASIERNPFYRPDFVGSIEFGLIESGTIDGMTHLVFTEKGLQALSKFASSSKDS